MTARRTQHLFLIERGGRYFNGKHGWTTNIHEAHAWPEKQAVSRVKIDIGMPCVLIPVLVVVDNTKPYKEVKV